MKKFAVLNLISVLILAFGATVYAQEKAPVLEFKASGFIDVVTEYKRNVAQNRLSTSAGGAVWFTDCVFDPAAANVTSLNRSGITPVYHYMLPGGALGTADQAFNKSNAYVENRGRLKFDAIMGKEMTGTFFFEFDSTRWGERAPSGAQRNFSGHWGVADRSSLELKNMFMTFGMPWMPIPTTIQAGIQPIVIRPGIFLQTDGPAITAAFKVDPATIKLVWAKAGENRDWASDDSDLYAIEAKATVSTMTVGGYYVLFNMNTYPLADNVATATGGATSPNASSNVWWAGLYADGKAGPLNLNLDAVYDYGKNEDRRDVAVRAPDVDFRGYGLRANISYPWEKFLFGFASIYGSGADLKKTSASALPGTTVANTVKAGGNMMSTKVGTYILPAGTEGGAGDSLILTGAGINRNSTNWIYSAVAAHSAAPIGGMWINKLYAAFRVSPDFTTRIEGMYVRDTTKNGNTIGTATKPGTFQQRDDDTIGWEIDWFNTLKIYNNLTFQFGCGYLFAGKAMDFYDLQRSIAAGTTVNRKTKDPWVLTTNLTYSF